MIKRLGTIVSVAAMVTAVGAPAMAQGGRRPRGRPAQQQQAAQPQQTEDPTLAQARAAYDEGRREFEAGHYEQALAAFERALQLRPNPIVLISIGNSQERLGRISDAIASFERYLRERPDAPDRAQIEQRLAELRRRPATLHVTSTPPGARILIDGRDTNQVTPADVQTEPGRHALRLELAGYRAATSEVDAAPGGRAEITQELSAEAPSTPATPTPATSGERTTAATTTEQPAARGTSPVVWVAGGLAAAGLVAGSVFGFIALGERAEFDRNPSVELRDAGESHALLADVFFGAAVLSAGVALVVYLSDRAAPPASAPAESGTRSPATGALPTRRTPTARVRPMVGGLVIDF